MWTSRVEQLDGGLGLRFAVDRDGHPAAHAEVATAWRDDRAFRSRFNDWLAGAPYPAFRWETPPISAETSSQPFEFVLLNSPGLAVRPDPRAFAEHLGTGDAEVVVFPNLGGDAILVVPQPVAEPEAYGHLAAFVRKAPDRQRQALWQSVGRALLQRVNDRPVWLSTAGAGVAWLHVRLDDRPKYYGFRPFRAWPR